jgi:putative transposase
VGSRSFVGNVKALLGYRAKGRDVIGGNEGHQPREGSAPYKVLLDAGNDDIGLENTYFWGVNNE